MSKVFGKVYRRKLMVILKTIMTKCELHVLINDVILNINIRT